MFQFCFTDFLQKSQETIFVKFMGRVKIHSSLPRCEITNLLGMNNLKGSH